jgi:hypothetical protein
MCALLPLGPALQGSDASAGARLFLTLHTGPGQTESRRLQAAESIRHVTKGSEAHAELAAAQSSDAEHTRTSGQDQLEFI